MRRHPLLAARMKAPSGAISAGYMKGPNSVLTCHGFADIRRCGDGGKGRLRIVAREKTPIEHQPKPRPARCGLPPAMSARP